MAEHHLFPLYRLSIDDKQTLFPGHFQDVTLEKPQTHKDIIKFTPVMALHVEPFSTIYAHFGRSVVPIC